MCRVRYCDGCSDCTERRPCNGCELCNVDVCACPDGDHLREYGVVAGDRIGDLVFCQPCGEKERLALLDDARLEAEAVPVAVDEEKVCDRCNGTGCRVPGLKCAKCGGSGRVDDDETTPVPVETIHETYLTDPLRKYEESR